MRQIIPSKRNRLSHAWRAFVAAESCLWRQWKTQKKKIGACWRKEELSGTESSELQAGERGIEKKNSIYDFIVVYSVFPIYLTD